MKNTHYQTVPLPADDFIRYSHFIHIAHACKFFSEGKNGRFELRVLISRHKHSVKPDSFNLAFGVWDDESEDLDDIIEVRNGESQVILANVGMEAVQFLCLNSNAEIYAEGSTPARTRLYQREIGKIIDYIPEELKIEGVILNGKPSYQMFQRGINYDGFLLRAK